MKLIVSTLMDSSCNELHRVSGAFRKITALRRLPAVRSCNRAWVCRNRRRSSNARAMISARGSISRPKNQRPEPLAVVHQIVSLLFVKAGPEKIDPQLQFPNQLPFRGVARLRHLYPESQQILFLKPIELRNQDVDWMGEAESAVRVS